MRDVVWAERSGWHIGVLVAGSYFPDNSYCLFLLELRSPPKNVPQGGGMEAAGYVGGLLGVKSNTTD